MFLHVHVEHIVFIMAIKIRCNLTISLDHIGCTLLCVFFKVMSFSYSKRVRPLPHCAIQVTARSVWKMRPLKRTGRYLNVFHERISRLTSQAYIVAVNSCMLARYTLTEKSFPLHRICCFFTTFSIFMNTAV